MTVTVWLTIWFLLGLYGALYHIVNEYNMGVEMDISVTSILGVLVMSAAAGGLLAASTLPSTFGWLWDLMDKPLFKLKKGKK